MKKNCIAFSNWYGCREKFLRIKERRAHFLTFYLYCVLSSLQCSVARDNFVMQAAFIFINMIVIITTLMR